MEKSRDLLVLATCRIFTNLTRLQPSLNLEAVTAPVDLSCRTAAMQKAAEAYASKFDQVEVGRTRTIARRMPRRRRKVPLRTVGAPQEARRPELFPAVGCAWGTHYLTFCL